MPPSNDAQAFRTALQRSKRIILVAGAGLSAGSGIPTFRGVGGYWRSFEATSLATPEAFRANPSLVWQFYHYRREKVLSCKPNNAHHVIARFLRPEYRESVAPRSNSCTLITQNVDGLSVRAKQELDAVHPQQNPPTSSLKQGEIIEMHGRLLETLCTKCQERRPDVRSPICPALGGTEVRTEAIMDEAGKRVPEETIATEELPHCEKEGCNGLLRPAVVWFNESIPGLSDIDDVVDRADFCIVVGTSSVVYPAAGFADTVRGNGGTVAVFNIEASKGDRYSDFLFLGPCEETLGNVLGISVEGAA
ncbi:DHS-like NAD/FAD-binding domain-containing protein [Ceratobasidium sp. AG-I]|nr:DHS-like NAD/FAD-binding domain-containing protein [Ceratobasidium sp. AG-I]